MPMKFGCGQSPRVGEGFGRVVTGSVEEIFQSVSRAADSGWRLPLLDEVPGAGADVDFRVEVFVGQIGVVVEVQVHAGAFHEHAAGGVLDGQVMIETRRDAEVGNHAVVTAAELDAMVAGIVGRR